jgi:arginyl-tRNA synthetase
MKYHIEQLIRRAIVELQQKEELSSEIEIPIYIERTRDKQFGDYACNIAMTLAKIADKKPRELAKLIVAHLPKSELVDEVSIAGPGFINFFITSSAYTAVVQKILTQKDDFGLTPIEGKKINVEFVSANPTGPLHVGHGRGAAYGATLANLLQAAGCVVTREYMINDAGRQMDILAVSVWLRYLERLGASFTFPSNGYKGNYIYDIADVLQKEYKESLNRPIADVFYNVPADESIDGSGDKEMHIDGLIKNAKDLLGADYNKVFDLGLRIILDDIRDDLQEFGVEFDIWFSERSLKESAIEAAIEKLRLGGHLYERDGALWFASIPFGDDKDRVMIRENGQTTYFASDVAYLQSKFERGYDELIYIFGADHHGYVHRLTAAAKALGYDPTRLKILLVQFATLYRGKEKVQMSTRSGSFITLRELREEIRNDAARFFYVLHKSEQHMDFDLELAKSKSESNPVYYIQYAYARICSVFRQLQEKNIHFDETLGLQHLQDLTEDAEKALLADLERYPEVLQQAALNDGPHQLANYLRELATDFHAYYNAYQFIKSESPLRDTRLCLIKAVKQVLHNGLKLLGVSAPEKM